MPDIALRFQRDMLVLSSSVDAAFERIGVDPVRAANLTLLLEPEVLEPSLRLEHDVGAQCIVVPTARITPARLAHERLEEKAQQIADQAFGLVEALNPQHVLIEIGPCGLPFDASSAGSRKEHRDQYRRATALLEGVGADAFFLNGFTRPEAFACAIEGVREASGLPIFISVDLEDDGSCRGGFGMLESTCATAEECGADVMGFSTAAPAAEAAKLAARARRACSLPLLVQARCEMQKPRSAWDVPDGVYPTAESMVDFALSMRAAGVQFLRASGKASPAYTGALVATVSGLDVHS